MNSKLLFASRKWWSFESESWFTKEIKSRPSATQIKASYSSTVKYTSSQSSQIIIPHNLYLLVRNSPGLRGALLAALMTSDRRLHDRRPAVLPVSLDNQPRTKVIKESWMETIGGARREWWACIIWRKVLCRIDDYLQWMSVTLSHLRFHGHTLMALGT